MVKLDVYGKIERYESQIHRCSSSATLKEAPKSYPMPPTKGPGKTQSLMNSERPGTWVLLGDQPASQEAQRSKSANF